MTLLFPLFIFLANAQCLVEAGGQSPPFSDDNGNPVLASGTSAGTQAIIPSYRFNCCAHVTRWETYVQPGGGNIQGDYTIQFQVWRPVEGDSTCYEQVGQNTFMNINLQTGGRVDGSVPTANILSVQPGDVVGLFVSSQMGDTDGIQLDDSGNLRDNTVYHNMAQNILQTNTCYFRLGSPLTGQLTSSVEGAPMLRVTLCKKFNS